MQKRCEIPWISISGLDVETAAGSDGNAAQVSAGFFACGHNSFHHIPSLEAENALVSGEISIFCQACALVTPAAHSFDDEDGLLPMLQGIDKPHAGGVETMFLRDLHPVSIPLGPSTTSDFYRDTCGFETLE